MADAKQFAILRGHIGAPPVPGLQPGWPARTVQVSTIDGDVMLAILKTASHT